MVTIWMSMYYKNVHVAYLWIYMVAVTMGTEILSDKLQRIPYRQHYFFSRTIVAETAMECCGICTRDDSCLSVSYSKQFRLCGLSSQDGTMFTTLMASNWDVYTRLEQVETSGCFDQSCYKLCARFTTWDSHKIVCEAAGGHLADIKTSAEDAYIRTLLDGSSIFSNEWFIGANDMDVEGIFRWSDGSLVSGSHTNWGHTDPNNFLSKEDVVTIWHKEPFEFHWLDTDGQKQLPAICEFE